MRKLLCALMLLVLVAMPSYAKPTADEYRNKDYNIADIKTVLILPVLYEVKIPESEAFFDEKVSQKWRDLTDPAKSKFSFLAKTPEDIVKRDQFVKGIASEDKLSPIKTAEKALSLADQYTDAILRAIVTDVRSQVTHHPEEVTWESRWEDKDVWVYDHWETRRVEKRYQRIKPAWDETTSIGTVKIELRDAKHNALIYGSVVKAVTGEGLFSDAPTLTTHICNILENAAKRIPVK